jgi:hypothetical protein
VTASSALRANAITPKPAYSLRNCLLRGTDSGLFKRDHCQGRDRILRLEIPLGAAGLTGTSEILVALSFYRALRRPETRLMTRMINATTRRM